MSREIKHTPGEWRLTERKIGVEALVPSPTYPSARSRVPVAVTDSKNPNREADAMLIAAAPELLEACERAADEGCNMSEGYRISRSTLELLVGAIKRAKGEE